jgi:hypothetical protein
MVDYTKRPRRVQQIGLESQESLPRSDPRHGELLSLGAFVLGYADIRECGLCGNSR